MSEHLQSLSPFLLRRRELKWTRFKNSAPPLTFIQMTTKSRLDRLPGELIFTRTHWIIFKQLSGMNQRFSLWWEKISFHLWQFGLHFCGWRPNHPCCGNIHSPAVAWQSSRKRLLTAVAACLTITSPSLVCMWNVLNSVYKEYLSSRCKRSAASFHYILPLLSSSSFLSQIRCSLTASLSILAILPEICFKSASQ